MTCYVVEYLACFQSNGRIWLLVARSVCQFGGRLTVKLSSRTDRVKLSSRTDKISCSTSLLHISIMSAACHIYFIHRSHQPEAQRESVCVCVCARVCTRVCVCIYMCVCICVWVNLVTVYCFKLNSLNINSQLILRDTGCRAGTILNLTIN